MPKKIKKTAYIGLSFIYPTLFMWHCEGNKYCSREPGEAWSSERTNGYRSLVFSGVVTAATTPFRSASVRLASKRWPRIRGADLLGEDRGDGAVDARGLTPHATARDAYRGSPLPRPGPQVSDASSTLSTPTALLTSTRGQSRAWIGLSIFCAGGPGPRRNSPCIGTAYDFCTHIWSLNRL
jgi:hypothetical protein